MAVRIRIIFLIFLTPQAFAALGDFELKQDGNKVIWNNNSQTFSISASDLMSESVDYTWPSADTASGGQALLSNGAGVLSWGTPTISAGHNILSSTHDAIISTVLQGDIIFGNSTPKWDDLAIGATNEVLRVFGGLPDWQATTFITTLGTIVTGTWNATAITVPYGGTGATSLTNGGLLVGSGTSAITALSVLADGEFVVGDGTTDPVAESGNTARTSLGLGTGDSPTFTGLTLSGFTTGSIPFAGVGGVFSQDNSNLFWDNTNKGLGIGTLGPEELLQIEGASGADGATPVTLNLNSTTESAGWTAGAQFARIDFASDDTSGVAGDGARARIAAIMNLGGGGASSGLTFSVTDATNGFNEATRIDNIGNVGIGAVRLVSLLEVDGPVGLAIETVTGNTTLDNTHSTLLVNASGNITITLPTAASAYNSTDSIGRIYRVKKIDADANTVTVDGNGAELIDGAATAVLTVQWETISIQSNGTAWYIL